MPTAKNPFPKSPPKKGVKPKPVETVKPIKSVAQKNALKKRYPSNAVNKTRTK